MDIALNELDQWLSEQEENTTETPYQITITGLTTENFVQIKPILQNNNTKYVDLRQTTLPNGITSLEEAFRRCTTLVYAPSIPATVVNMSGTFRQCSNLKLEAVNYSQVVTNMNRTYYMCSSLTGWVGVPSSVTDTTSTYARTAITEVSIDEGTKQLVYTFENCTSLETIHYMASTLESLNHAFAGCTSLKNINFMPYHSEQDISKLTNYNYAFEGCTNLRYFYWIASEDFFNQLKTLLQNMHNASINNFPNDTTECSFGCYYDNTCHTETNVDSFAELVENEDARFFGDATITVTKINGINDLDDLEEVADALRTPFHNLRIGLDLRPTVLPNDITSLEEAFMGCRAIIYYPEIPSTVTDVTRAFSGHPSFFFGEIESPAIPSTVTKLTEAFKDSCVKTFTIQDISYANNWTDYTDIFEGCNYLTTFRTDTPYELKQFLLNNDTGLPTESSNWRFIPYSDTVYVHIDNLNNYTKTLKANTATTPYKIIVTGLDDVSKATKIRQRLNGKYVDLSGTVLPTFSGTQFENFWNGCSTIVKTPAVPNGITSIWKSFYNCSSLKEVPSIPNGVTSISCAFEGCSALEESPVLPSTVTDMSGTFKGCESLIVPPEIPSTVTDMQECFSGCTSLQSAPEIPSGVTNMFQTFYYCESIENVPVIPEGVTNMEGCFRNCYEIKVVPNIPSSVTNMSLCFRACENLEEITKFDIPISALEDANNYFENCFSSCPNLTKIGIRAIKEEKDGDRKDWHIVSLEVDSTSIKGKSYDRNGNTEIIPQTTVTKGNIILPFITDELLFTDQLLSSEIEAIIENMIAYKYGYFNDKVIPANQKSFVLWADDKRHVVTNIDMGGGTDIDVYPSEQAIIDDLANLEVDDIVASDDPNENETIAILMAKIQELEEIGTVYKSDIHDFGNNPLSWSSNNYNFTFEQTVPVGKYRVHAIIPNDSNGNATWCILIHAGDVSTTYENITGWTTGWSVEVGNYTAGDLNGTGDIYSGNRKGTIIDCGIMKVNTSLTTLKVGAITVANISAPNKVQIVLERIA